MSFQRFLDMRYVGQEFPIQTPVSQDAMISGNVAQIRAAFDEIHDRRYGHQAPNEHVEIVNTPLDRNRQTRNGPNCRRCPHRRSTP